MFHVHVLCLQCKQSCVYYVNKDETDVRIYITLLFFVCMPDLASFPGLARLSLAVRNLRRRPGLVHHVIHATGYIMTILQMS